MIAAAVWTPVPVSPMAAPQRMGSRSGKPVTLITPPVAWAIMSKLLYSWYGPESPKPLMRAMMMRGFVARSRS